jgi:uncharacterized membrane protein YraQ (UPF0718 family)
MSTVAERFFLGRTRDRWRPIILVAAAGVLLSVFWFTSRYPQLISKAEHVGQAVPSMAYSGQVITAAADSPVWMRILATTVNWLNGMKIGMSFGVLFGALLHTVLRYYPLRVGRNLYLNSLKGALVGIPLAVCANCAVPVACGVTRGHGRVEVALSFLFSSPSFNPVVVTMSFLALPLSMVAAKYAALLLVILIVVPSFIGLLERRHTLTAFAPQTDSAPSCTVRSELQPQSFWGTFLELANEYRRNVWMLLKPTVTLMLAASVLAATLLVLIPWSSLLSGVTPIRLGMASLVSVFMPVPIALDVMFAAQLNQQGVAPGYVMLFAMTLGTYSIIPTLYLFREVSRSLALGLFALFVGLGWILGLLF